MDIGFRWRYSITILKRENRERKEAYRFETTESEVIARRWYWSIFARVIFKVRRRRRERRSWLPPRVSRLCLKTKEVEICGFLVFSFFSSGLGQCYWACYFSNGEKRRARWASWHSSPRARQLIKTAVTAIIFLAASNRKKDQRDQRASREENQERELYR